MIEKLYTVYFSEMVSYTAAMTKNRSEAEDIVQETFLRAMANLNVLSSLSDAQCRSWLYKTAKNIFIDRVRKNSRISLEESFPDLSEEYSDDLSILAVAELLKVLPEDESLLFRLRYFCGYNSSELASLYSIPPGTVRSKLSSARKKLKDILKTLS